MSQRGDAVRNSFPKERTGALCWSRQVGPGAPAPFTRAALAWYGSPMRVSYVGIVTPQGLAVFLPEGRATRSFVEQYARRTRRGDVASFWSVLDHGKAQVVGELMEAGDFRGALLTLDRSAERAGTLLPSNPQVFRSSDGLRSI
jgi:hypothetical protein